MVEIQKSQEIGIKFTTIDCSNFDKRCSGAHFVSFLFYYYCTFILFPIFDSQTLSKAIQNYQKISVYKIEFDNIFIFIAGVPIQTKLQEL